LTPQHRSPLSYPRASGSQMKFDSSLHRHFRLLSHLLPRRWHASPTTSCAVTLPLLKNAPRPAAVAACSYRRRPVLVAVNLRRESNFLSSMRKFLLWRNQYSRPAVPRRARSAKPRFLKPAPGDGSLAISIASAYREQRGINIDCQCQPETSLPTPPTVLKVEVFSPGRSRVPPRTVQLERGYRLTSSPM
jgi:hypothetical protein